METRIKTPKLDQIIESGALGFRGKVVAIAGYNDTFERYHAARLVKENELLQARLGDNFRELFFECTIEILHADPGSEYEGESLAVLTWEEYQTCTTL